MEKKIFGITLCNSFRGAGRDYYELRFPPSLRRWLSLQSDAAKDEAAIANQDAFRILFLLEAGSESAREQAVAIRRQGRVTFRQMRWLRRGGVAIVVGDRLLIQPSRAAEATGWMTVLWSALFVGTMLCLFATTPFTGIDAVLRQLITLAIYSAVGGVSYATFVAPSRTARRIMSAVTPSG